MTSNTSEQSNHHHHRVATPIKVAPLSFQQDNETSSPLSLMDSLQQENQFEEMVATSPRFSMANKNKQNQQQQQQQEQDSTQPKLPWLPDLPVSSVTTYILPAFTDIVQPYYKERLDLLYDKYKEWFLPFDEPDAETNLQLVVVVCLLCSIY